MNQSPSHVTHQRITQTCVIPKLRDYTESRFYQKLVAAAGREDSVRILINVVDHIAKQAEVLSQRVVEFFPQYTDHGPRHLLNVLGYMDWLAGDALNQSENDNDWSPLECAIALTIAWVHDLGMVPGPEEQTVLTADKDPSEGATTPELKKLAESWVRYRDGDPIWAVHKNMSGGTSNFDLATQQNDRLGQIRANFLRLSHADDKFTDGESRIRNQLTFIAGTSSSPTDFFTHEGFNWLEGAVICAMSHNQDIRWLEHRLTSARSPYHTLRARGEAGLCRSHEKHRIHWPRLGWLLRLADVLDMDASRTPAVLFTTITDSYSRREWRKHLSINDVRLVTSTAHSEGALIYTVGRSMHPSIEAALREMAGWIDEQLQYRSEGCINDELDKVRSAQARFIPHRQGDLPLRIPGIAIVEIHEREGDYHFHDLQFRLDREAIMNLLMGEALYGQPDLALRELVQNSLDALHLRELRIQLSKKIGMERTPSPAFALMENEELAVNIRWGQREKGGIYRNFIEVSDNGVGMTKAALIKYLTQIGKSFYKSPEFARERAEFERNQLLCTTISQFGIGFLSSFMLADDIEVYTRAKIRDEHGAETTEGWRIEISGTSGLMALYPLKDDLNGLTTSGTTVTLWLKNEREFAEYDYSSLAQNLSDYFFGESYRSIDGFDPAWAICRRIVWPRFSVKLHPPDSSPMVVVDPDGIFYTSAIIPRLPKNQAQSGEKNALPQYTNQLAWIVIDWVDSEWRDAEGNDIVPTGTRVRRMLPILNSPVNKLYHMSVSEMAGEIEKQSNDKTGYWSVENIVATESFLPSAVGRTMTLLNGIALESRHSLRQWRSIEGGVGGYTIVDIQGRAVPCLKVDRSEITDRQSQEAKDAISDVGERANDCWPNDSAVGALIAGNIMRSTEYQQCSWTPEISRHSKGWPWVIWTTKSLAQHVERKRARDGWLSNALLTKWSPEGIRSGWDQSRNDKARTLNYQFGIESCISLLREEFRNCDLPLKFPSDRVPILESSPSHKILLETHVFAEAFGPYLEGASPLVSIHGISGNLEEQGMIGPLTVINRHCLRMCWDEPFSKIAESSKEWMDVDLVAPLTKIALGNLRKQCVKWTRSREWRTLFMLPFLFGSVPIEWRGRQTIIRQHLGGIDSLLLYVPDEEGVEKVWTAIPPDMITPGHIVPEFWTEEKWRSSGVTFLWDIEAERVLWANGLRTRSEVRDGQQDLIAKN